MWAPGVGRTGLGGLGSCWVPGTESLKENRREGRRTEGFGSNVPTCFSPPQPPAAENNGILSVFPSSAKCPRSPKQFALRGHTFSRPLEGCFHTKKLSEREEPMSFGENQESQ